MLTIAKYQVLIFSFRHSYGNPGYKPQMPMQFSFARQVRSVRKGGSRLKVGSGAALETLE